MDRAPDRNLNSVTRLIRQRPGRPPRRVDILESDFCSGFSSLMDPGHTARCNLIMPFGLVVPFPALTTQKRYAVPKWRPFPRADEILMRMSGFAPVELDEDEEGYDLRCYLDKRCMVMTFVRDYAWTGRGILARDGEIFWQQ